MVYSDHKPLEAITKKLLDRAPKRLQGVLVRALAYDIKVQYLNGKEMFLADTLSRAFLPKASDDGFKLFLLGKEEFEELQGLESKELEFEKLRSRGQTYCTT